MNGTTSPEKHTFSKSRSELNKIYPLVEYLKGIPLGKEPFYGTRKGIVKVINRAK